MATTYYIDPTGDNGTGDGSSGNPWATLSYACSQVTTSGDTIYCNAGSYTDNTACTLAIGVNVDGAGKTSVTITTSASNYLNANSSGTNSVDGSNTISNIKLKTTGSNTLLTCDYRNNTTITYCAFESNTGYGVHVSGRHSWVGTCGGNASNGGTYCDDNYTYSKWPASAEFVDNFQMSYCDFTIARFICQSVKNGRIHHCTFDCSGLSTGTEFTMIGNVSDFWRNMEFDNNTMTGHKNTWDSIGMEIWMIDGGTKFHDNTTDMWWSLLKTSGQDRDVSPLAFEVYDNTFDGSLTNGIGVIAEICYDLENVKIYGNYFNCTTSGVVQLGLWGGGTGSYAGFMKNVEIYRNVFYNTGSDGIQMARQGSSTCDYDGIYIWNNVFDTLNGGASSGLIILKTGITIDTIHFKNNILKNANYLVVLSAIDSGGLCQYNFRDSDDTNGWVDQTSNWTINNNTSVSSIGLNWSGSKPDPYYKPTGSGSNVVDAGTDVGLSYSGSAPDVGRYELTASIAAPIMDSITATGAANSKQIDFKDTLTIAFSKNTNQVTATTKTNIDSLFTFSEALGDDYTGAWSDAATLVITVADPRNNGNPQTGSFQITAKAGNGIKDETETSDELSGISPTLSGGWRGLVGAGFAML